MKIKFREKYMAFKFKMKGINNPYVLAKQLEISQYWDDSKMSNYHLKKLNRLFERSRKEVKYYQNGLYTNVGPFVDLKDFINKTPVLDKNLIKGKASDLMGDSGITSFTHTTSGSTGRPMIYQVSAKAESYRFASNIRFFRWYGLSMYDKNVLLWKKTHYKNSIGTKFKNLESRLLGRLNLSIMDLNESSIHDYYNRINQFKPKYIRGYKSGIYQLVSLMDKYNLSFDNSQLKLVIVTAENLYDFEREYLEKYLKCKVANEYGAAEGGLYAVECPEGSLHINEESIYLRTDCDQNAYTTEMYNDSMPLINYKNEDMIVLSDDKCSCGRNLKVISSVQGRSNDYIECSDGSKLPSLVLIIIIGGSQKKFNKSIAHYRATQIKNKLEIELVPGRLFSQEVLNEIKHQISDTISPDFCIEFKLVDFIKRDKSAKLKAFRRID